MATQTITTDERARSDAELVEAVYRREFDAVQKIYNRYQSVLRNVIKSVLHDENEIDDTLDDVFLQLWNQIGRFDPSKGLHGFLVTMARRRALDRLRRRLAHHRAKDRFEAQVQAGYLSRTRAHEFQTPSSDLAEVVQGAIGALPAPQQQVIKLTFFEGLSQREISACTFIRPGHR